MSQNNRISYLISFFLCFCFSTDGWSASSSKLGELDPFFSYTAEELQTIRSLPLTQEKLTQEKLIAWDDSLYTTAQNRLNGEAVRLMAYLYVAQRDFALLIYGLNQQWLGNPDALITDVISLFYPNFQSSKPLNIDSYSAKVGQLVFNRVKDRFQREQKRMKDYPEQLGALYWKEEPPIFGQRIGSCYPWLLNSLEDFRASPPPPPESIIWASGLDQIQFDQRCLSKEQKRKIYYWANELGPESGNWFAILNHDLENKSLDLAKFLFIRAVVAMGYSDAMTVVFDSKYTYWVRRPRMVDPRLNELVRRPKHPSYPSGHSTTSSAIATILSYFFPEEAIKWRQAAIEAGNTRVWAGLHFPIDNVQGLLQGEKVGGAILERLSQENKHENLELE